MIEYKQHIIEEDTVGPFNFMYYHVDDPDGKFHNADTVAECKKKINEIGTELSIGEYFMEACKVLRVEPQVIRGEDRHREPVMARAAIATKLLELFPFSSLTRVGMVLNRNHATVIYYRDRFVGTPLFDKCLDILKKEI